MQTAKAKQQEITHDQTIAVLTIATWKKSSPALGRWFQNAARFFEYLEGFDPKTANAICKAHTEAGAALKVKSVGKFKTILRGCAYASKTHALVWYGRIVCRLYKLSNAFFLWTTCHIAASFH